MAISKYQTGLPLDEYARIMGIAGWHFNQVLHPTYQYHDSCDKLLLQNGYMGAPPHGVGRDEIATAIRTAEQVIRRKWGFNPYIHWNYEKLMWPNVARGSAITPIFVAGEGFLISGGVEAWSLEEEDALIVYSDEDGDGVDDTATITFATTLTEESEIVVVPPDVSPTAREWRIRPLDVSISGGTCTITGPRWLFVDPDRWDTADELHLEDDTDFLEEVDVYRRYNDSSQQAKLWYGQNASCADTSQTACLIVRNPRIGSFKLQAATYDAGSWTACSQVVCGATTPVFVEVWYRAGYDDDDEAIKQAIVSLANNYLPNPPCTCASALARWEKDNEEIEITTTAQAQAQNTFGRLTTGLFMAWQVLSVIPPIAGGGGFKR